MMNKAWSSFKEKLWSVLETEKPDINEDIPRMVLYLNKNYSPSERLSVIHGVVKGLDESLKRDIELFKMKYQEAHETSEELNKKHNYDEKT